MHMAPVDGLGFDDPLHSEMLKQQRGMWPLIQPVNHF